METMSKEWMKKFIEDNSEDANEFSDRVKDACAEAQRCSHTDEPNILNTILTSPDFMLVMSTIGAKTVPFETLTNPEGVLMFAMVIMAATVEKLKS